MESQGAIYTVIAVIPGLPGWRHTGIGSAFFHVCFLWLPRVQGLARVIQARPLPAYTLAFDEAINEGE